MVCWTQELRKCSDPRVQSEILPSVPGKLPAAPGISPALPYLMLQLTHLLSFYLLLIYFILMMNVTLILLLHHFLSFYIILISTIPVITKGLPWCHCLPPQGSCTCSFFLKAFTWASFLASRIGNIMHDFLCFHAM